MVKQVVLVCVPATFPSPITVGGGGGSGSDSSPNTLHGGAGGMELEEQDLVQEQQVQRILVVEEDHQVVDQLMIIWCRWLWSWNRKRIK